MIEKERLEELIEQGAIIYKLTHNNRIDCRRLRSKMKIVDNSLYFNYKDPYLYSNSKWCYSALYRLFENKEDAEWHKEFGCIERTERLELPTWEEFIKNYQTLGDNTILDERCVMFTSKTRTYSLYADDNSIWVGCDNTGISFFCEDLNKENYIKACRFCKRLFLGEVL